MDRETWWATVHGVVKESDMTEGLNNKDPSLGLSYYKSEAASNMLRYIWQALEQPLKNNSKIQWPIHTHQDDSYQKTKIKNNKRK